MRSMPCIERATSKDLYEIEVLEKQCFSTEAFNKRQLKYLLINANSIFLLIRDNEEIAAYLILLMRRNSSKTRIYSIAVSPKHRGMGLAKLLINKAIAQAKEHQHKYITLEVSENNKAAIKLYSQQGFVRFSEKQTYYRDGSNALLMRKTLG